MSTELRKDRNRAGRRDAERADAPVADPELKKDPVIVLAAAVKNKMALKYADGAPEGPEFVLAAVKQDGRALKYADPVLRNDPES